MNVEGARYVLSIIIIITVQKLQKAEFSGNFENHKLPHKHHSKKLPKLRKKRSEQSLSFNL